MLSHIDLEMIFDCELMVGAGRPADFASWPEQSPPNAATHRTSFVALCDLLAINGTGRAGELERQTRSIAFDVGLARLIAVVSRGTPVCRVLTGVVRRGAVEALKELVGGAVLAPVDG